MALNIRDPKAQRRGRWLTRPARRWRRAVIRALEGRLERMRLAQEQSRAEQATRLMAHGRRFAALPVLDLARPMRSSATTQSDCPVDGDGHLRASSDPAAGAGRPALGGRDRRGGHGSAVGRRRCRAGDRLAAARYTWSRGTRGDPRGRSDRDRPRDPGPGSHRRGPTATYGKRLATRRR